MRTEVNGGLRSGRILLCGILLAVLLNSCAVASERWDGKDFSAALTLTGRGMTSTASVSFENRSADTVTFVLRDIALNGECTGYSAEYKAPPGQQTRSVSFRRSELAPVTVCDVGVAALGKDGSVLFEETLTALPYGESAAKRPSPADFTGAAAAFDSEEACLLILPPSESAPGSRTLWFFNKSERLMRLRLDRILADGRLTDISLTMQALPLTGQFADLALPEKAPETLLLTLTGYTAGKGDEPVFRTTYEYRLSNPVSVPTLAPANTPARQIGIVTIRRSGAVNVRESDTTDSKKVGSAKAGKTYPCYGISSAGWYLIRLEDGTEGYVTNTLTTLKRQ